MTIRSAFFLFALATTLPAQSTIDWNLGTPLGAGDDTISTVSLAFAWTCPCGGFISSIDIDSNGRIFAPGADTSDFSQSIIELLADDCVLAPAWRDWTFTGPGDVYYRGDPTEAVVTWHKAQIFPGGAGLPSYTFQAKLFPDGSFWFTYCSIDDECLVGYSTGGDADPGASDFSTLSVNGCSAYESFPAGGFDLGGGGLEFVPAGPTSYAAIWHPGPVATIAFACTATPGLFGAPTLSVPSAPVSLGEDLCVQFDTPNGALTGLLGIMIGVPGPPFSICTPAFTFCLTGGTFIGKPVTFVGGSSTCCFDTCDALFGLQINFQGYVFDNTSISWPCMPLIASRRLSVNF